MDARGRRISLTGKLGHRGEKGTMGNVALFASAFTH
jgi:hypothetical protein